MRRRHESHGIAAFFQNPNNLINQIIQIERIFDNLSDGSADLKILAIAALKIASGEKYIADSDISAQYRFFSAMKAYGRDIESRASPAIAQSV